MDGQEYKICPECGEDALQLEGSSIACLNCGWEKKQAEPLDIAQYCDLMEEVKSTVEAINQLMELPGITIRTRVESICLQPRMILELIVFSSLVSNKDVWRKSKKELESSQDISKKLRELKRLPSELLSEAVGLGDHRIKRRTGGQDRGIPERGQANGGVRPAWQHPSC